MPSLGADMDAGTVVEWLVAPGDRVRRGDIVAVVETDKADIEVEIFESGVIEEILVPSGQKVPVGTPLARVRPEGAPAAPAPPAPVPPAPAAPPPPAPPPPAPPPPPTPAPPRPADHRPVPMASPVVRRLARHLGVDLAAVTGTGPGGTVTRADVEAAARAQPLAAAAARAEPRDRAETMRRSLADLMARSKREIPHYYLATEIDFSRARTWLDAANASRPVTERLLPVMLLLKAVALAARATPVMNGTFVDGAFVPASEVNVGVAIALRGGGLIAPALARVDEKPIDQVGAELRDLVERTRRGRLRSSEMSGPTITVTSLGDQGAGLVLGVIYPPQVAIVGFGKVRERPWAENGMVGARPVVTATLSGDHRVSDGHRGSQFLGRIDRLLQEPERL